MFSGFYWWSDPKNLPQNLFPTEQDENDVLKDIPLLVLGNKNDLPNALTKEQLTSRLKLDEISNREVAIYSISCKNQDNLDNTINWLVKKGSSDWNSFVVCLNLFLVFS